MQVWELTQGPTPFLFVPGTVYIKEGLFHSWGITRARAWVSDRFGQPNRVNLRDYDNEAAYSLKYKHINAQIAARLRIQCDVRLHPDIWIGVRRRGRGGISIKW
jgi:hypothetical protein